MRNEPAEPGRDEPDIRVLRARHLSLTPREHEVMARVVAGATNKEAAVVLGMSHYTVKVHRSRVMFKMKAASRAELIRMAERLGESV